MIVKRHVLGAAALLISCAGDFSPEIGTTGSASTTASATADGTESDTTSSTATATTADDWSSTTSAGSSTTDGTGTTAGDEPPGPEEPCDPFGLPCEDDPNMPAYSYACAPVIVEYLQPPDEGSIWGFRCATLLDTTGSDGTPEDNMDGVDPGDICSLTEYSAEDWETGCRSSYCMRKYDNPLDPPSGQQVLPGTFCADIDPNWGQQGQSACCTPYCKPGGPPTCPGGMKCLPYPWPAEYTEPGSPTWGYCVDQDYTP